MSALMRISYRSHVLLRPVEIIAALHPSRNMARRPALWALHCAMEDGNFFFSYLDAARLAEHLNIAIIAPGLGNGFFLNTAFEAQADFLEELADALPSILNISVNREENAIVGISMGGFGALRWALASERFFGAAAISGAFDASLMPDRRFLQDKRLAFIHASFDALMKKLLQGADAKLPAGGVKELVNNHEGFWPALHFYCGNEDYLCLAQTKGFYEYCKEHGAPCQLQIQPGSHDIDYWRVAFPEAVKNLYGARNPVWLASN